MKTLADLKRDIIGKKLILKEVDGIVKNEVRTCVKLQGNSFVFLKGDTNSKSYLEIPKSTLLEYDGKTVRIYLPAVRELTDEEIMVRDHEPVDEKQDKIDMLSDGSVMFYRRKQYYQDVGMYYLFGTEKEKGKRLTHVDRIPMIQDDSIKGKLSIVYEVNQDVQAKD